jgi:NAD(P)-dependent dehydrogenase (short-subunit alcohol dehydrogenase family)
MALRFHCPAAWLQQSLEGKRYLITGVRCGLGFELTQQLLKQGATVLGISRKPCDISNPNFQWQQLDLADLQSVQQFSQSLIGENRLFNGLINNAATLPHTLQRTIHDLEMQWCVNYLSPVLLTESLKPLLIQQRVIHLSSSAHHSVHGRLGALHFNDIHFRYRTYDHWMAYAQSKLALTIHAKTFAKLHPEISIVSVHPGWVMTNISTSNVPLWVQPLLSPWLKHKGLCTSWEGIQPILYALLAPKIELRSGELFGQTSFYEGSAQYQRVPHTGWLQPSPNPIVDDPIIQQVLEAFTHSELTSILDPK